MATYEIDLGSVIGPQGPAGANGVTPTIKVAAGANIGSVGTPSVSASTSGTTTTLTFNYLKGAAGTNGTNGTTPTLQNNLTTTASGYALDARQGNALKTLVDAKTAKTTATVSLPASGWVDGVQTVSVTGVTASNTVVCTPDPASFVAYCGGMVRCTAQAAGSLTFTAETAPEEAVTVNVLILS